MPVQARSKKLYSDIEKKLHRKAFRRKAIRVGLVASNLVILAIIAFFVLQNPHTDSLSVPVPQSDTQVTATANPLDQVSSADIALTVSRLGGLPETTAVTNQAQSQAAEKAIAAAGDSVVAKPQVVATALKSSADIKDYTAVDGDTVASIATKFGVTSDSVRWSNGLTSDKVNPGTNLVIPPVNGIVYTVKAGDTPDSLATKFRANKDKIIAYNDAEINGLVTGQRIIIPDATQISSGTTARTIASSYSFPWGGSSPVYGYNGYDYGYCTWYVATQIPVPSNWGNASTWAYYAGLSGWNVSTAPAVGSIAQTAAAAGGLGHVAVVDAVSADGSQIQIRDMNGVAGFGRVGYSGWISASSYQHYISR
jgi:surface antigen